jgi:hypothetical protein
VTALRRSAEQRLMELRHGKVRWWLAQEVIRVAHGVEAAGQHEDGDAEPTRCWPT